MGPGRASAAVLSGRRQGWRAARLVAAALAAMLLPAAASAQHAASGAQGLRIDVPDFWNLAVGVHWSQQPQAFQEFACGTNGGPPSLRLAGFADFATCPADANGLHEVTFNYDDALEYWARAMEFAPIVERTQGTRLLTYEVVLSVLIDDDGIVRGIRAVTDNRVSIARRQLAYSMPGGVRTYLGAGGWECVDVPPEPGEEPLGAFLIKEDCTKAFDDGRVAFTVSRLLRKPGQTLVDPANAQIRVGYFESIGRLEIYDSALFGGSGVVAAEIVDETVEDLPADATGREAFLAGLTDDCPDCDLAGVDLRRRNLAGADLSGANLSFSMLHRTILAGANLEGADLRGTDLNLADLKRANLSGADLTEALMYGTDAAAAVFAGAVLDRTRAQRARFTGANLTGAQFRGSLARNGNYAGANLTGAVLTETFFAESDFQRATLVGADLTGASFYQVRFISADLSGATATGADLRLTDLTNAVLVGTDLTDATLNLARSSGADFTDAIFAGTIMPDGRPAQ
ncbi:MAG: pentapeptide repeat-containing protein [Bauldia sp.]|nr:pentapeptide repeat-containing protein [Bauldia sp.]